MIFEGTIGFCDPSDDDFSPTIWRLKPLSVGDMMSIEGMTEDKPNGPGTKMTMALKKGLVGWENFLVLKRTEFGEVLEEISYSERNLSNIPIPVQKNIINKVFEISVIDATFEQEIRNSVRAAFLKVKSDDDNKWNCDHCKLQTGWQQFRRCPFLDDVEDSIISSRVKNDLKEWDLETIRKGKVPKWITASNHAYPKCPVGLATGRANTIVSLIFDCMNSNTLPVNPPTLLNQPYFFIQARNIVESERRAIEKIKKEGADNPTSESTEAPKSNNKLESAEAKEAKQKEAHKADLLKMVQNRVRKHR